MIPQEGDLCRTRDLDMLAFALGEGRRLLQSQRAHELQLGRDMVLGLRRPRIRRHAERRVEARDIGQLRSLPARRGAAP